MSSSTEIKKDYAAIAKLLTGVFLGATTITYIGDHFNWLEAIGMGFVCVILGLVTIIEFDMFEIEVVNKTIKPVLNKTKTPFTHHHVFNPVSESHKVPKLQHSIYDDKNQFETLVAAKAIRRPGIPNLDKTKFYEFSEPGIPQSIAASKYQNKAFHNNVEIVYDPDDTENTWRTTHNALLQSTLLAIEKAISVGAPTIHLVYQYDGIWAYAAGYWPTDNYPEAQSYVEKLNDLSSKIKIKFDKYDPTMALPYASQIKIADAVRQNDFTNDTEDNITDFGQYPDDFGYQTITDIPSAYPKY